MGELPCLLTADILAQNALGLFHRGLQTKCWLLEREEGAPESQRGLPSPRPSPEWLWTGLTSSSWTCCSIRWCSSGSVWKAWWGRSVGGWGCGSGSGARSGSVAGPGRRAPESRLQEVQGGGWTHILQVSQQLRGLCHMVGLRLTQAVQDSVESFLVEQGPLRHSRVTSGPAPPPQGLSPASRRTPRAGTKRSHRQGGERALAGSCGQHLSMTPAPRFLPPRGRNGAMEARSGEQGEKTECPGGPGRPGRQGRLLATQARGCGPQLPAPPVTHTCSCGGPLGAPAPGSPSSAPGSLSSAPGLHWLRSIGAQLPYQRELSAPGAPTSFPSPEETALLIGRPRSLAPQRRK